MNEDSFERVKMWYEAFKKDSHNLNDTKGFIAICNIDWLIKELESKNQK